MYRYAMFFLAALAAPVLAGVVSYEATSFPDEQNWERRETIVPAERWLDGGWFVQYAELADPGPPHLDEEDIYEYSLAEFAGADRFFVEWRMETNGPREGFPNVSPAALVVSGRGAVWYHFTMADDQVRFIRDPSVPILFVDIEPGVPHIYRLDLFGDEFYTWQIDGELVDYGIPEAPYPTSDSVIVFGARAAGEPITARWDYIRFGEVPEPASGACLLLGTAILLWRRKRPHRPPGTGRSG